MLLPRADCPERCEGLDVQCVGCGVTKGDICRDARALIDQGAEEITILYQV